MRRRSLGLLLGTLAATSLLIGSSASATLAATPSPWWHLGSDSVPTYLHPGDTQDLVRVRATNVGDANVNGAASPVTLTDRLPPGLRPTKMVLVPGHGKFGYVNSIPCPLPAAGEPLSCTFGESLPPFTSLEAKITVEVSGEAPSSVENTARISGGQAPSASLTKELTVSDQQTPFGISNYELVPELENEGTEGTAVDRQAGSHPFQLTTALDFNQTFAFAPVKQEELPAPTGLVKDLQFQWPAGLIGNPTTIPQCSELEFATLTSGNTNLCKGETAVGVATIVLQEPLFYGQLTETVPVFNLTPGAGEPARFGFEADQVPVVIDTSVRTGGDYGVTVSIKDTNETIGLRNSLVTIWGVPGDPAHNQSRGWECLDEGFHNDFEPPRSCTPLTQAHPAAFLSTPTACSGPLSTTAEANSWGDPNTTVKSTYVFSDSLGQQFGMEGCGALAFQPSISVQPDERAASTPSGVAVGVHLPQESGTGKEGLAEADVRDTVVTLPAGLQLNPAGAVGLSACSLAQIDLPGSGAGNCPTQAKVGTVEIKTPDLKEPLEGAVYVASPQNFAAPPQENPFGSLFALYIVAEDPAAGVVVKLAGQVTADPVTGQLVSTFQNTPQLPFTDLELHFLGGPNAPLSTPALCGSYSSSASFTPWAQEGASAVGASSAFSIDSGSGGGACQGNPQSFAPSFKAGSMNTQAGGLTPFTLTIGNPDGDQPLQALTMHLPPGVAALLSSVTPCPEPQAASNECGAASLIGHSVASSGLGGNPYPLPGQVYLTGPYKGAPFGLSVVTPAVAGPFNLGVVTVRSTISVDPSTAAVTITSDPFPTIIRGVPVQLKRIEVTVERPGNQPFQFNPTSCDAKAITATLSGAQGASVPISYPFQVANCANLPFAPKLTASAGGKASKAHGTSFVVKIQSPGLGQANIHRVDLTLPKQLPTRLTTIQKACLAAVFAANPAGCPEGSNIGTATVHTPVLKAPLRGPAYLVSHGNAGFPDVEFVLQAEGIKLILDGKTDIKKGITYSRFESAPDAPFTSFETDLPAGPHSALTSNVPASRRFNLCGTKLSMPTEIGAQNGALIKQTTKIAVTGCGAVLGSKTKKLSRAQKLKRALKACRKKRHRRASCEAQARRRFAPKKAKKKSAK